MCENKLYEEAFIHHHDRNNWLPELCTTSMMHQLQLFSHQRWHVCIFVIAFRKKANDSLPCLICLTGQLSWELERREALHFVKTGCGISLTYFRPSCFARLRTHTAWVSCWWSVTDLLFISAGHNSGLYSFNLHKNMSLFSLEKGTPSVLYREIYCNDWHEVRSSLKCTPPPRRRKSCVRACYHI